MNKYIVSLLLLSVYGSPIRSADLQQQLQVVGLVSFVTIGTILTKNITYNTEPPPATTSEVMKRFTLLGIMTPFSVPMISAYYLLPISVKMLFKNDIQSQREFSLVYFFPFEEIKNGDKQSQWKPKPLKNIQSRGKWYGSLSVIGSIAILYNTVYLFAPLYYEYLKQVV